MELSLSAEMGVEAAGMDGYRLLPAAKAVFVLHGFLFKLRKVKRAVCGARQDLE